MTLQRVGAMLAVKVGHSCAFLGDRAPGGSRAAERGGSLMPKKPLKKEERKEKGKKEKREL
jgi:hypothetical protein